MLYPTELQAQNRIAVELNSDTKGENYTPEVGPGSSGCRPLVQVEQRLPGGPAVQAVPGLGKRHPGAGIGPGAGPQVPQQIAGRLELVRGSRDQAGRAAPVQPRGSGPLCWKRFMRTIWAA